MTVLTTEQIHITNFYQQYARHLKQRKKMQKLFCESRLSLLVQAHLESESGLGQEEWVLAEGLGHFERANPWEHLMPPAFGGEEDFWQILFTEEYSGHSGRRNFIEYFNGFLKEAGLKLELVDIVTRVFFTKVR